MSWNILRLRPGQAPWLEVVPPRLRGQIRHRFGSVVMLCLGLLWLRPVGAQPPQITAGGVVNAGSYAQPISPGSIVSIFGTNLASTTVIAPDTPWPITLAETSVKLNGIDAPLLFVSPEQINLQAPWSLQSSPLAYGTATAVVTTPSGSSTPAQAPIYDTSPAIYSLDASGCGQALALNVAPDGSVSVNAPSNSAAPGDYVSVYGTGFGPVYNPPPPGTPGPGLIEAAPGFSLDGQPVSSAGLSAGLAPTLVGSDQIGFQIPTDTREGCAVPIVGVAYLTSPTLAISIHSGRGQCVDPPTLSYGQVLLTRTVASGTENDGETDTLTAVFPSAPGMRAPTTPTLPLYPNTYSGNNPAPVPVSRSCPVAGYTNLSAGVIQVQAINTGASVTAHPIGETGGVNYQQTFPAGFIAPGTYTISASGGAVTFQTGLNVGSPIQIQTPFPPGTTIPASQPLTIRWTGGISGGLVKATLLSANGINSSFAYGYADAGSGSFTFAPWCSGSAAPVCSFLIPSSANAQIILELSPESPVSAGGQGLTGSVQALWTYRYVFAGLVLGP